MSFCLQEEYQDKPKSESQPPAEDTPAPPNACGDNETLLIELSKQLEESPLIEAPLLETPLLDTSSNSKFWARMFTQQQAPTPSTISPVAAAPPKANNKQSQQSSSSSSSSNPWLELFADLDPLANPQAFDLKLSGGRRVAEQT